MDAATFRQNFPEFASTTTYPDAQVTFWLGIAANMVSPSAWGVLTDLGLQLFTAHNLTQAARSAAVAAVGGTPGQSATVLSAKSVDKVSASYDTGATTLDGAGNWNATDYGVRFHQYAEMMGAGGLQL
ncbi:MAG: hypothetical protein JWQ97_3624 [Phenylobacterium sp.]|nr:hypothetical protein [Phenylobacterium sp.]